MTAERRSGPRGGDVLFIGRAASVRFSGANAFNFRVIRVDDKPTYDGWLRLEGYVLGPHGDAIERRSVFVQLAGLRPAHPPTPHGRG